MMPKLSLLDDLRRAAVPINDGELAQRVDASASGRALERDRPEAPVVEF
jgi:hypothetical protein